MNKSLLLPALLVVSHAVFAQQPPSAGSQLQQIPPVPAPPRVEPQIRIEPRVVTSAPAAGPEVKIVVRSLRITGSTVYPESELLALTGFVPGRELSLIELQSMAARVTEHYRRNGYFVAQAFLPAQDIKDESVTMTVSEGRYGQIVLRNTARLPERVARSALQGVESGGVITAAPLESRLLRLADVPGVNVKSTLVPGAAPGTSDLIVEIEPGQRIGGSIDADNGGNRYTGEYRAGATVNLNNPLGLGDVASLRLLTSGSGLNYGRISYQLPVGRAIVGVALSGLTYELGKEFSSLQAHGTAQIASVYARYPLLRSRTDNIHLQVAFDAKRFHDAVDSIPATTDRNSRVAMASLHGDHRDNFGAGGLSSYGITLSAGNLDIETPSARANDALTARTQGNFDKLSFSLVRLQSLGGPFSVYAGLNGQLASKNLDVSEKMELGGMNGVRAYPEGEGYADEGAVLTIEGRYDLPKTGIPGQLQFIVFADAGTATLNHSPWAPGPNHRTLSGAGIGLNWAAPNNFVLRASYAHKLGGGAATSAPDRSGRLWLQGVKYF